MKNLKQKVYPRLTEYINKGVEKRFYILVRVSPVDPFLKHLVLRDKAPIFIPRRNVLVLIRMNSPHDPIILETRQAGNIKTFHISLSDFQVNFWKVSHEYAKQSL